MVNFQPWKMEIEAFFDNYQSKSYRMIKKHLFFTEHICPWSVTYRLEFKLQRKYRIKYHHETVFWNHKNQDNSYFVDADSAVRHKQCSDQMKLFLVKLNFLNLKKVNIQSTKFNMVSKQQKYQYVFTPPPRCPRRSPRTTTIWRTRLAFPNNCRPGLLAQHLL